VQANHRRPKITVDNIGDAVFSILGLKAIVPNRIDSATCGIAETIPRVKRDSTALLFPTGFSILDFNRHPTGQVTGTRFGVSS
jgi:hypothetical protein